ncbi:hypothetical protein [Providencia rettgeri]|nr:hypothetical protein [Providencia rettgeri]
MVKNHSSTPHDAAFKGLQLGTSIELICQLTGLSYQEVLSLQ